LPLEQRSTQLCGFAGPELAVDEIAQFIQPTERFDHCVLGVGCIVNIERLNGPVCRAVAGR
jgi:hypothetical protein